MDDQEKLKKRLSRIFTRKGEDGHYTRLFENLESAQRRTLLSNARLSEGELPIIGSLESSQRWLLLTTQRIIWNLGERTQSLPLRAIRDVVSDFRKLVNTGRKKDQMRELQILTMGGEHYTIELEPGAPLIGTWNALKNIGAGNRREISNSSER